MADDFLWARDGNGNLVKVAVRGADGIWYHIHTINDGGDITFGAKADGVASGDTETNTFMAFVKRGLTHFATLLGVLPTARGANGGVKIEGVASGQAVPVSGTFWQTTQPTSDNGPAWAGVHGISGVPFTSADAHSSAASVTDAPTSNQKLVPTDIFFSVDTAMSVTFKCETTGAVITGPYHMPANSAMQLTPRDKSWKLATVDKKLQVITSVAGNIMVDVHYYSEA